MESRTSIPSQGSPPTNTRKLRSRPLQTCGVSFLTLAAKAYNRAERVHGPVGFIAQKIAKFADPIVFTMQYQWLTMLAYADDQILAVEALVETIFPPAAHVFDKMHTLVQISEAIPEKLDNVLDQFPTMIHRKAPILSSISKQLSSVLNFLVSTLTDWRSDGDKEKEIMIDINCNEGPIHDQVQDHENEFIIDSNSIEESSPNAGRTFTDDKEIVKDGDGDGEEEEIKKSCKDMVEMEKKEDMVLKEEKAVEDQIVELFSSGWYS